MHLPARPSAEPEQKKTIPITPRTPPSPPHCHGGFRPPPPDTPLPNDSSRSLTEALDPPHASNASLDPAIELFNGDYDRANGRIGTVDAPSPRRPVKTARTVAGRSTTRSHKQGLVGSPMRKPRAAVDPPTSPARRSLRRAAGVIVDVVDAVSRAATATPAVAAPPGASSVTPLETIFTDPPKQATTSTSTKKRNSGPAMFGLVPKSGFLVNQRKLFEGSGKIDDAAIAAAIKKRRENVLWHFSRVGKTKTKSRDDGDSGPVTRSALADLDDWMVDMDAVSCAVTDQRRLSRYAFEHLVTLSTKTKLLLFVHNDENNSRLSKALRVESIVGSNRTLISGREYLRLRIALDDVHHNERLTGRSVVGGAYLEERFMTDFKSGRCGFSVSFSGTKESTSFTWKEVMSQPKDFMFFGAPLNVTRSFDEALKNLTSLHTLHHRFVSFYDHFEGDVEACLALINSYLARRTDILANKAAASARKAEAFDSKLFRRPKVVAYLNEFDELCKSKLIGALSKFRNHSEPLVPLADMQRFINRAPDVFGGLWSYLSDLRGIPKKKKSTDAATDEKTNSVFFLILTIARITNRRSLTHWALIQNISSFARGVGRTAESAFAFFGSHLSSSARELTKR